MLSRLLTLILGLAAFTPRTAALAPLPPLRTGDIVLQTSSSAMAPLISRATHSPFTHVGLVEVTTEGAFVIEAVQPVQRVRLEVWRARGVKGRILVRRWPGLTDAQAQAMFTRAREFLGRPYDVRFAWDDGAIYCSELVAKAYAAAQLQVGRLERLDALALGEPEKARARQLGVDLSQQVLTPQSLAEDAALVTVSSDFAQVRAPHPGAR
jgi:hypothetical protein